MNANELADELDHVYELTNIFECKAGADTIRQQQAEIEALQNENQYFKDRLHSLETLRKSQEK